MPGRPQKSLYARRLEQLESLSLRSIARELNDRRRQQLGRKLTSNDRASFRAMQKVLRWLFKLGGGRRDFVMPITTNHQGRRRLGLAARAQLSDETVRRAVRDLEEASILWVKRRERARRQGGQGASAYTFVWATIEDLAKAQGLQYELFSGLAGSEDSAARGDALPDSPSGLSRAGEGASAEGAPPHLLGAPPHLLGAQEPRARDSLSPSSSISPTGTSPSLRQGFCGSSEQPAVEERGEGGPADQWHECRRRLVAYPLTDADHALRIARRPPDPRRRPWTAAEVLAMVGECERLTIGGVRAYKGGAIHYQLTQTAGGTPLTMDPRPEYIRAKREAELARERRRQAEGLGQSAAAAAARRAEDAEIEHEYGPLFEQLSPQERAELYHVDGQPIDRGFWKHSRAVALRNLRARLTAGESEVPT